MSWSMSKRASVRNAFRVPISTHVCAVTTLALSSHMCNCRTAVCWASLLAPCCAQPVQPVPVVAGTGMSPESKAYPEENRKKI